MNIYEFLQRTEGRLRKASFSNDFVLQGKENHLEFTASDNLYNIRVEENMVFATYSRVVRTIDNAIAFEVVYDCISYMNDKQIHTNDEVKNVILSNPKEYVKYMAAEAALIIANLAKAAGFPPLITASEFVD